MSGGLIFKGRDKILLFGSAMKFNVIYPKIYNSIFKEHENFGENFRKSAKILTNILTFPTVGK